MSNATATGPSNPEAVAHELAVANLRLAREREVPESLANLVADIIEAVLEADPSGIPAVDEELWAQVVEVSQQAEGIARDEDISHRRRDLRLAIEQLRFLFARISERIPFADQQPAVDLLRWLVAKLARGGVDLEDQAWLVGVDQDTLTSWLSEQDPSQPSGGVAERVRLAARVIAELLHSVSPPSTLVPGTAGGVGWCCATSSAA